MKLKELVEKYGEMEIDEIEVKKVLNIQNKVWKPKDEPYISIMSIGMIEKDWWYGATTDEGKYSIGNCFKTKEEAEFIVEKLKVINSLKLFAAENNQYEIDWNNIEQEKFFICYDTSEDKLEVFYDLYYKNNLIYFSSEELCKKAINAIGEDRLIKYYFEIEE